MSIKSWRRLAGYIAIECLTAAQPEYRAGAAASGHVRAVVLEDRRGFRAVFAESDFAISRAVSDFVAVQLVKRFDLDRAAIVISGTATGVANPVDLVAAIEDAMAKLDRAGVAFSGAFSIRTPDGACIATLYPISLDGCRNATAVHGPIRAAFQMIDVPHPLQTREGAVHAYPIQAVAIGKPVVLALGGPMPPERYSSPGRIVVPNANDNTPMPDESLVAAGIANVLRWLR